MTKHKLKPATRKYNGVPEPLPLHYVNSMVDKDIINFESKLPEVFFLGNAFTLKYVNNVSNLLEGVYNVVCCDEPFKTIRKAYSHMISTTLDKRLDAVVIGMDMEDSREDIEIVIKLLKLRTEKIYWITFVPYRSNDSDMKAEVYNQSIIEILRKHEIYIIALQSYIKERFEDFSNISNELIAEKVSDAIQYYGGL
jgi:hypothetical protein